MRVVFLWTFWKYPNETTTTTTKNTKIQKLKTNNKRRIFFFFIIIIIISCCWSRQQVINQSKGKVPKWIKAPIRQIQRNQQRQKKIVFEWNEKKTKKTTKNKKKADPYNNPMRNNNNVPRGWELIMFLLLNLFL